MSAKVNVTIVTCIPENNEIRESQTNISDDNLFDVNTETKGFQTAEPFRSDVPKDGLPHAGLSEP